MQSAATQKVVGRPLEDRRNDDDLRGIVRRGGELKGWTVSITLPANKGSRAAWQLPMGVYYGRDEAVLARDMECFRQLVAAAVAGPAPAGKKGEEVPPAMVGSSVAELLAALDSVLNSRYSVRWRGTDASAKAASSSITPGSFEVDIGSAACSVWVKVDDNVARPLTSASESPSSSPLSVNCGDTRTTASAPASAEGGGCNATNIINGTPVDCNALVVPSADPLGGSGYIPHDRRTSSWADAATAVYAPIPNFVFDVSVCHSGSLGISLCYFTVPFSRSALVTLGDRGANSGRVLGCIRVASFVGGSNNILNGVLQPGDLVLRVNDTPLVADTTAAEVAFDSSEEGGSKPFFRAVGAITNTAPPRVLRILRIGSMAAFGNATRVCPAEILAYVAAPPAGTAATTANNVLPPTVAPYQHVCAKFSMTPAPLPTPSAEGAPSPAPYTITLSYVHHNCPPAIKKMLQGTPFHWRVQTGTGGGVTSSGGSKRKLAAANASAAAAAAISARDTATAKAVSAAKAAGLVCGGGVFQESLVVGKSSSGAHGRFLAVLEVAPALSVADSAWAASATRSYCVGRYDTEDEAAYAYKTAVEEATATAIGSGLGSQPTRGGHTSGRSARTHSLGRGPNLYVMRGGRGIIRRPPPPAVPPSSGSGDGGGGMSKSGSSSNLTAVASASTPASSSLPQHHSSQSLSGTPGSGSAH